MNILLTGGSGFIGKNIVENLSNSYNIYSPGHKELDLVDEIAVGNFFKNNKVDIVIHSATKPGHRNSKDTSNLLYYNTRMFFNILKNSDYFSKMIFIGSGAMYDSNNYLSKMKEEYFGSHIPTDEHGFSKYICGKYIEKLNNVIELRVFGVFGKYEDYSIRFISNAICKVLYGLPITIKQNKIFDYLFIDDLISVLDYFINNDGKYSSYNVTPDRGISLYTLAEKIIKISGVDLPINVAEPGFGKEYTGDNSRIKNEIKDLKFKNIDDSIQDLLAWYKKNIKDIDINNLLIDK